MSKKKSSNDGSLNSMLDELIYQLEEDVSLWRQNRKMKKHSKSPIDGQKPKPTSRKSKKFAKPVACKKCSKEYKYLKCLKNHKCKAIHRMSGISKTEPSKRKHQKSVKFAENLENFIMVPFQCPQCQRFFNHRRGFLHHGKTGKCITNQQQNQRIPEQSLSSRINALYSLFNWFFI